ncbi:MAG: LuxR C-terminal-related transcriptional regulator [Herbaspirillum sp.]
MTSIDRAPETTLQAIDYQLVFQQSPVGMCVSERRNIRTGNLALEKMFEYASGALSGQSFLVIYPTSADFERIGARIVPIMTATGSYSDDRIMKRANQELFWCHVTGRSLNLNDPHAAGIWTFEDLSAKRVVSAELTLREREISTLLADGKTSKEIARMIGLSPRTVEMHRAKLMRKFNAATSSELIHRLLGGVR